MAAKGPSAGGTGLRREDPPPDDTVDGVFVEGSCFVAMKTTYDAVTDMKILISSTKIIPHASWGLLRMFLVSIFWPLVVLRNYILDQHYKYAARKGFD